MVSTIRSTASSSEIPVTTLLMWIAIILLAIILVSLLVRLYVHLKSDNQVFYTDESAINLRVDRMPELRIVTKNCKDFRMEVFDNSIIISYANPFGGVKEFECTTVGDPVEKPFVLLFKEADFKKLCFHLKPGNIAIYKNKITFNYNLVVRSKLVYLKKEV